MSTSPRRISVSLSRGLGLFDITMIGVGAMIGAGIFGLTGIAAGHAGPVGLLLAFFLNGIVTSLTATAYAELGAAFPEAGGGYLWVREGMSRFWGFFSGWISWFSHSVACSLYAVIFGTFLVELLKMAGFAFPEGSVFLGMSGEQLAVKGAAAAGALVFIYINYQGASETGLVGNFITVFKIFVLGLLVAFGVKAMLNIPNWSEQFLANPLPNGIGGVLTAMGLTFVAFEGYEIIAQSGEEVRNPERNIPLAIFLSIAIVVAIYLAVAFVSIGALIQDSGLPNWVYLGRYGERAMIETARRIIPYGAVIMILGGLASTTSALNATIYSSSRVSFAMGRAGDLPEIFGRVHPRKRTPHWAIALSGALIIAMALWLPVQDVASGASLTFLLLFLLINISLIRLRKLRPDLPRSFRAPLVPWLQYASIAIMSLLVVELFQLSPLAWGATLAWFALGIWVYRRLEARNGVKEKGDVVLLEETIASRAYSVLVPVANEAEARELSPLGALLARANGGELFALHVIRVPRQVGLGDGRAFLKQGRPILEEAIEIGQQFDVPVRTMLRLGRDVGESIISAARERQANLLLLGWPGYSERKQHAFGSIIDLISASPPCDLAVVRLRRAGLPKRILVPVAGGPNSQLALEFALAEADGVKALEGREVEIIALHLVPPGTPEEEKARRKEELTAELGLEGLMDELHLKLWIEEAEDITKEIVAASERFDQVIMGASEDRLLEQTLFGSIPKRVAEQATTTVIMVKAYNPVKFGLRRWLARRNGRRPPEA